MSETVRALFPQGLKVDNKARDRLVTHLGEPQQGTLFQLILDAPGIRFGSPPTETFAEFVVVSDKSLLQYRQGRPQIPNTDAARIHCAVGDGGNRSYDIKIGGAQVMFYDQKPALEISAIDNRALGGSVLIQTPATPKAQTVTLVRREDGRQSIHIKRDEFRAHVAALGDEVISVDRDYTYPIGTNMVIDGVMQSVSAPGHIFAHLRHIPTGHTASIRIPFRLT